MSQYRMIDLKKTRREAAAARITAEDAKKQMARIERELRRVRHTATAAATLGVVLFAWTVARTLLGS